MKDLHQGIMGEEAKYHTYTVDYLKQISITYTLINNTMYTA